MSWIRYILCLSLFVINGLLLSQSPVKVGHIEIKDSVLFKFTNTSETTLFLFSTYFEQDYITSIYLHQIDKSNDSYIVSFLPLTPYLSAYLTDRIVLGNDKIITEGQNLFQFVELKPKQEVEIKLSTSDLFGNIKRNRNAVKAFSESDVQKKKFKKVTYKSAKKKYNLFFEFATYENIDRLSSKAQYISGGNETYYQSKSYKVIRIKADLKAFN